MIDVLQFQYWIIMCMIGFILVEVWSINQKLKDIGYVHINIGSGEDD